jgi:hypothetical protein
MLVAFGDSLVGPDLESSEYGCTIECSRLSQQDDG